MKSIIKFVVALIKWALTLAPVVVFGIWAWPKAAAVITVPAILGVELTWVMLVALLVAIASNYRRVVDARTTAADSSDTDNPPAQE